MTSKRARIEELAGQFTEAFPKADLPTLRRIFHPDATVWHNWDRSSQPLEENLTMLQAVDSSLESMEYVDVRRYFTDTGWVQQHVVRGKTLAGAAWSAEACIVFSVRDGRIERLEEYIDPAQLAALQL